MRLRSTTIPVREEVKEELRKIKGNKSWDELLMELISLYRLYKMEKLRKKLGNLLELEYEEVRVNKWAREY